MSGDRYRAPPQSEIEAGRTTKSRVWRWRNAVTASDLPGTTRHVIEILSHFMDKEGGSCFPTIADLCARTGRSKKTVQSHLRVAERAGWIVIQQGVFGGQRWKRYNYVARWPDADRPEVETREKVVEMATEAGGIEGRKVGEEFPQDNNSPDNISDNGRASARGEERLDRRKVRAAFLRWLPTWPGYDQHSDEKAARVWFSMTDRERADCIALTPLWLEGRRRDELSSPAVYLRKRRFYEVQPQLPEPPERLHAPYCGPLWMAWWLWQLVQPPNGRIVVTALDEVLIQTGKTTRDALMREKRRKHGWPDAVAMIETFRAKRKLLCPFAMKALSAPFGPVLADSALFAAWSRLHERRDWPFPDLVGKVMYFPPIQSLAGNLDDEVEVALAVFEEQVRGVFDGRK